MVDPNASMITLITKENEKVKVSVHLSKMSHLIKNISEDLVNNEEIPVELISKPILDIIINYVEHHRFKNPPLLPSPLPSCDFSELIDAWHNTFLGELSEITFNEVLFAANYLQIKSLLDLLLGCLASKIKDKDIPTLCQMYSIQDPLTPDLEDELLAENSWIFDVVINPPTRSLSNPEV